MIESEKNKIILDIIKDNFDIIDNSANFEWMKYYAHSYSSEQPLKPIDFDSIEMPIIYINKLK